MKPLILLGTLVLCAGSWFPESGRAQSSFDPAIAEMISHVSDSTMRQSIADLQGFGTRWSFASNRDSVVWWILERFLEAGLTDVMLDGFQSSGVGLVNVVATIHGTSDSEIVVGAHYDSWTPSVGTAPGADDDASGTSAVIEMARVVSALGYTPASTIRFIAFSGEEQGLVGSSSYARKAKNNGTPIRAMLNFDQIGYRNVAVGDMDVYLVWYQGGEELMALDTAVIRQYTTLTPALYTACRGRSDSYSFAAMGYPAVWWLECDGYPFYHTTYDLLDFVDVGYAAEIARSALALVLTLDKSTVDVHQIEETLPTALRLYQNYPNPFNPSTAISFQLPVVSDVRLVVYDILGRELAVLANEQKLPGSYEVKFDASGLASGVYLYRLTAGGWIQTRRMVVIK